MLKPPLCPVPMHGNSGRCSLLVMDEVEGARPSCDYCCRPNQQLPVPTNRHDAPPVPGGIYIAPHNNRSAMKTCTLPLPANPMPTSVIFPALSCMTAAAPLLANVRGPSFLYFRARPASAQIYLPSEKPSLGDLLAGGRWLPPSLRSPPVPTPLNAWRQDCRKFFLAAFPVKRARTRPLFGLLPL